MSGFLRYFTIETEDGNVENSRTTQAFFCLFLIMLSLSYLIFPRMKTCSLNSVHVGEKNCSFSLRKFLFGKSESDVKSCVHTIWKSNDHASWNFSTHFLIVYILLKAPDDGFKLRCGLASQAMLWVCRPLGRLNGSWIYVQTFICCCSIFFFAAKCS